MEMHRYKVSLHLDKPVLPWEVTSASGIAYRRRQKNQIYTILIETLSYVCVSVNHRGALQS